MKSRIDSSEISIVVQGPVYENITDKVLIRLRELFPDGEIILSTWNGSNVEQLTYDIVIFNEDPGATPLIADENVKKLNNQVRMLVSSQNGLHSATRKYALRWRSDLLLKNAAFLAHFDEYKERCDEWKILEKRVLMHYATHPMFRPFHPTDIACFGLTKDVLNIWDISRPSMEELYYFLNNPLPEYYFVPFNDHIISKIGAEPYVWSTFLKKHEDKYGKFDFRHYWDLTKKNLYLTELTIANNLQILPKSEFSFESLNHPYLLNDVAKKTWLTDDLWLYYYKKYCLKHISIFDFGFHFIWPLKLLKYKLKNNTVLRKIRKLLLTLKLVKAYKLYKVYKSDYLGR